MVHPGLHWGDLVLDRGGLVFFVASPTHSGDQVGQFVHRIIAEETSDKFAISSFDIRQTNEDSKFCRGKYTMPSLALLAIGSFPRMAEDHKMEEKRVRRCAYSDGDLPFSFYDTDGASSSNDMPQVSINAIARKGGGTAVDPLGETSYYARRVQSPWKTDVNSGDRNHENKLFTRRKLHLASNTYALLFLSWRMQVLMRGK